MNGMDPARTANLLGALSLAVVDRVTAEAADALGHGAAAPAALVTLSNSPDLTIGGLARIVQLSHPGTVRLVDRLAADGLVARHRGDDGREVVLGLTAAGRRAARDVLAARAAVLTEALGALPAADRSALDRVLPRLLAALSPDPDVADHTCRLCDERACPLATCPVEQAIADQRPAPLG
jgi:DNA-binding MarR family transcriptional regulator